MVIGVVVAMENELAPFLFMFPISEKQTIKHNTFYHTFFKGHQIIAVCSGRGKVNASIYTQQLISNFTPNIVINVGVSGGISSDSKIYDLYLGKSYCHHDIHPKQLSDTFPMKSEYLGDSELLWLIQQLDIHVKQGKFGTGEGFVSTKQEKKRLSTQLYLDAVDMESAAVAQCCFLNDCRFLAIRGICDQADEEAITTTEDFQMIIANKAFILFKRLMESLLSTNV